MKNNFSKLFQAISDKQRQKILMLLNERDRCVGEIVDMFQLSQSAVSKHLGVLKNAGLVNDKRCGQQVFYSINGDNLKACCQEYFKNFECCHDLFASEDGDPSLKN